MEGRRGCVEGRKVRGSERGGRGLIPCALMPELSAVSESALTDC